MLSNHGFLTDQKDKGILAILWHFLSAIEEVGMLEVDRQSGGFAPHAPLNRVPLGCSTGVESLGYVSGDFLCLFW